ncbi:superoxide dismutase [Cu-Zn] 5-like isoform X2 [Euwallacea fornicatus]|uniref:superoxide dismutase [Cu-Zn] 5-like isoform X2 n=1 Tax=Euwallacea fornicatus TaxID=995702 RepID=UPI00338D84DD
MQNRFINMLSGLIVLGLAAVASAENRASAYITPFNGSSVEGLVNFTETLNGVLIQGRITGLRKGAHGFHIHVYGDLSNGCISTGGHFNPKNVSHGAPDASERHVGDLGNIESDDTEVAAFSFNDTVIALSGENNIIGRSVVIHSDPDDMGLGNEKDSKTTGHAGLRIGCGVIGTKNDLNSGTSSLVATSAFTALVGLTIAGVNGMGF